MFLCCSCSGVEVKPGKGVSPYGAAANALGKLRITQATLGGGSSNEKTTLQCLTEEKKRPIFLCTLLPDRIESCSLDLEFDEDDSVTFSVLGSRSIHISGYFLEEDEADAGEDDYGLYPLNDLIYLFASNSVIAATLKFFDKEDISSMGSEESSDYSGDDASESDLYFDSDDERYNVVPKSGVVIEEITDEEKAVNENSQSKQEKKNKQNGSVENLHQGQIVPRNSASVPVLESEDEDGFPISKTAPEKKSEEAAKQVDNETTEKVQKKKKRNIKTIEQDDQSDRQKKGKKQKKLDKEGKNDKETHDSGTATVMEDQKEFNEVTNGEAHQVLPQEPPNENNENQAEKKKKKKKNKKSQESGDQQATTTGKKNESNLIEEKPSQVRTFPNGLVVEELAMGKPDGKRAAPGKRVSVHYIGKLQKNGEIFDSNVGRAPFKFRLGIGQVIKGWDVGVNGMRVGDKRRLVIPPSMGYGVKGAGGKIPPNSWLVFDVELVDVR
ncbi:hypothetical protein CDL15_Pgr007527 [Punica granatum]|uniref:peptidylprolyl isomerase n=1 Tax=Punica granatum TaxID=22663 RepID=A0A218X9W4_PUNGR|nr:hypothetical protein CDL15_Pgr007527 [Punica granatum]